MAKFNDNTWTSTGSFTTAVPTGAFLVFPPDETRSTLKAIQTEIAELRKAIDDLTFGLKKL